MGHLVTLFYSRLALRIAMAGAAAGMLAGCSNSERLSDPFGNPFASSARVGDPGPAPASASAASAPVTPVQSRPLGAPAASSALLAQPTPHFAAAPASRSSQAVAGWSVEGGSPVVIAQGENGDVLAKRYGVPLDALVRTNGFASASQLQPGTRVIIPVYNAALAASSGAHAQAVAANAASKPATPAPARYAEKAKLLKGGVGATKVVSAAQPANGGTEKAPVQAKTAIKTAAVQASEPAKAAARTAVVASKAENVPTPAKAALAPPKQEMAAAKAEAPSPEVKKAVVEQAPVGVADAGKGGADSANPEFRWPARGRIIQAFKAGSNDGINIAVPEGTSVKAAEAGVVAYAGNELKGYGNLILIRHPNGFVTAYANTSDIEVKRGDTVKRGQTIAKSGQTGDVDSPQLHFELRKGPKPVDPTQYLAGL